jgi:hypothetical protein
MSSKKSIESFQEYVWSFYGQGELYGDFFDNNLTREELYRAVAIRLNMNQEKLSFAGDTLDREIVRDIMLYNRGKHTGLEYDLKKLGVV